MRIGSRLRRFLAAREGTVLVFAALTLAVFLGFVALSFDIGRVASTQSELQSFADNVALAAAGELDGGADAITRATSAATNLISDSQTFGTEGQDLDVSDFTLTFHSALPAEDQDPMASVTTDPATAAYARVVVDQHTVGTPFAAALGALTGNTLSSSSTVAAEAVAGFTTYACDITPMFFCLPPGWDPDANIGQTILLRSGGNSAGWFAGNFGFLGLDEAAAEGGDCDGLNAAQLYRCLLGAEGSVTRCFAQNGVQTEPGQRKGLTSGPFNTRFDMYKAPLSASALYPPAPNVIKGLVDKNTGDACIGNGGAGPSPNTTGLPPDDCFTGPTPTCSRFGDADWSDGRANYVATNYGGADPHPSAKTRYDYYKAEAGVSGDILSGRAETGRPSCSSHTSAEGVERRTWIAGGVNCDPASGGTEPGGSTSVVVQEWVKVFLLSPVAEDGSTPPAFDIWVEVVGSASTETGSVIHDVVQLYR